MAAPPPDLRRYAPPAVPAPVKPEPAKTERVPGAWLEPMLADMRGLLMPHAVRAREEQQQRLREKALAEKESWLKLGTAISSGTVPGLTVLGLAASATAAKLESLGRVEVPHALPPHLRDLAQRLNDPRGDFADPVARFRREVRDVADALRTPDLGAFDPAKLTADPANLHQARILGPAAAVAAGSPPLVGRDAAARLLGEAFHRFTADARDAAARGPQVAEYGSREAADLVARAAGQQSPEDLLRLQTQIEQQQLDEFRKLAARLLQFLSQPTNNIGG